MNDKAFGCFLVAVSVAIVGFSVSALLWTLVAFDLAFWR